MPTLELIGTSACDCDYCNADRERERDAGPWRQLFYRATLNGKRIYAMTSVHYGIKRRLISPCFQMTIWPWTFFVDLAFSLTVEGWRWMRRVHRRQIVMFFRL